MSYKNGLIPAMLVDTATKNSKWNNCSAEKNKNIERDIIPDQKGEELKKETKKNVQKENESIGSIQKISDEENGNQNNVEKVCTVITLIISA